MNEPATSIVTNPQPQLSKNAQKKAARKQEKKAKKLAAAARLLQLAQESQALKGPTILDGVSSSSSSHSGGKAWRARRARNGETDVGSCEDHRASGGAPVAILPQHAEILSALEEFERNARLKQRPEMKERKDVPTDNHGSMEDRRAPVQQSSAAFNSTSGECSLCESQLRAFSLSLLPTKSYNTIVSLDLSRNELWDLPADVSSLVNLTRLDLSRNWFRELPASLSSLTRLESLLAAHNMLRGSRPALQLDRLKQLPNLKMLDLSFNQKCGRQTLADAIHREMPNLEELRITISFPPPEGAFVGSSAAERDATLLRSQLEPWGTAALRRRLVADFGEDVSPPEVPRARVMERLLELYQAEQDQEGPRVNVQVEGTLVDPLLREQLLMELRVWSASVAGGNRERPSIKAQNYMILSSPSEYTVGSQKGAKAAGKLRQYQQIWDLAYRSMLSVDPGFAQKYTALAVTHGFQGSPHIDKQNIGPFYGMALGNFEERTGGICVECSARVVATVNTKNRLGKVDGRYPHWVAPYDMSKERYSLIYYQTSGTMEQVGPAVFENPILVS